MMMLLRRATVPECASQTHTNKHSGNLHRTLVHLTAQGSRDKHEEANGLGRKFKDGSLGFRV